MVATHTRVAYTTKGQVFIGDVHNRVVDTSSARRCEAKDTTRLTLIGKNIHSQWLLSTVNKSYRIIEAIDNRHQVILKNYASSHTGVIRDRLVEPFGFTTNYVQIWCYEPESGLNKLFNTSRVGGVEVLDSEWQYADSHHEGYIDIFRITGFEQKRVQLELGVMSHNLLIEEYPLSTRDIKPIDDRRWLLDTMVCNYVGIGRFVMGLLGDIRILTPEFKSYICEVVNNVQNNLQD